MAEVDWNKEWSQFTADGMRSDAPKGREPPSKAEKVAAQAEARLAGLKASIPDARTLTADWRFWIAIVVALSVVTAVIGSAQTQQPQFI
jgi:hypothetical protein